LVLHAEPGGITRLCGWLADQSALFGVLSRIHSLNLVLVSVTRRSFVIETYC
jgi:hypothetical protein